MTNDGRKLDHKILEQYRMLACARVARGEAPSAVIESLGLCRTTIYKWLRLERRGGTNALRSSKALGPKRLLNRRQRRAVRNWIVGKDPRHYRFAEALWTRRIVAELIKMRFGIQMSITAVGELLAHLDITPQRPLRRAYERDAKLIRRWQEETYPSIVKRAKKHRAEILFLDEAGIQSDAPLGLTWGAKGKTPIVHTSGQRQKVDVVSAVSSKGGFLFGTYNQRLNAELFVEILKRFTVHAKCPYFFIVDGHPAHRAKVVQKFIKSTKGRIELYFLPPYAPDLNPDEFVWNHLKQNGLAKKPLRQNESLSRRINADLRAIKRNRKLVRSFFKAPSVAYASAS